MKKSNNDLRPPQVKEGFIAVKSILPATTPVDQIPADYIQTSDGYWISPKQYDAMRNHSRLNLGWEIRRINPTPSSQPTSQLANNTIGELDEETRKRQREEIHALMKPITEEQSQRLADMKKKARYLLDEF